MPKEQEQPMEQREQTGTRSRSADGGRPIGQGRREGKQSDRFELSRQTGLRRKPKGKKNTDLTD